MTKNDAIEFLLTRPYKLGHLLGFTKLTELHNQWIIDMVRGTEDKTLQAHRGSYKTTCVSIAATIILILLPHKKVMFMRKTDADTKEIVSQVRKMLMSEPVRYFVSVIYGVNLELLTATQANITTNLSIETRGTAQLSAMGINGSITGKHFDLIFTDDIVNVDDRVSKAERDHTKLVYQELQNIKNRGGRIFNTGTPWHKEDCFTLMPNIQTYDCYSTGLISPKELELLKQSMAPSLFAANYELRHIPSDEVIFTDPEVDADPVLVQQGISHIDAAYGGEDYTAFTICKLHDGKFYLYGRMWRKHVDDVMDEIVKLHTEFMAGRMLAEDNGDKGYLVKEIRRRYQLRAFSYHEYMNKDLKITTYLKAAWKNVVFVAGTDKEYIQQICDYTEEAEHDDAPDSAASIIRQLWRKQ